MKAILVLLLLLSAVAGYSQRYLISPSYRRFLYDEMYNPLDVLVEGYPCEKVWLSTDNGNIRKDSCKFFIRPSFDAGAIAHIYVKVDSAGVSKTVDKLSFFVHGLPYPSFKIGPSGGGRMYKKVMAAQEYVRVEYNNLPIDIHSYPDSFTVTVIRNNDTIFTKRNYTNAIDPKVKEMLNSLKQDDIVLFSDIWSTLADEKAHRIDNAVYTITEKSY